MKLSDLSFDGDCGRINTEIDNVIEPTHSCPKIKKRSVPLKQKTMSIGQCITRLKERNPCTRNCAVLKEYLDEGSKVRKPDSGKGEG